MKTMDSHNASITITEFIIGGFEKIERPMEVGVVILIVYMF